MKLVLFPPFGILVRYGNRFRGLVRAFAVEMIFELVAPLLHDTDCRQRRGVAQRAKTVPEYVFREFTDKVNIFFAPTAVVEAVQHLPQPCGAFTTGDAPTAGFVRV